MDVHLFSRFFVFVSPILNTLVPFGQRSRLPSLYTTPRYIKVSQPVESSKFEKGGILKTNYNDYKIIKNMSNIENVS